MERRLFSGRGGAALAAVFLAISVLEGVGGTSGITARTWDQDITVPAGPYRAAKPIVLEGRFNVTVQSGALIEGVDFAGKADQRWSIDGALLRRTRIVGELGVHLTAKDTAFDDCTLHRVGGWFVSWWGSKWRFENCVFSKRFMIPSVDVGNYAIRAVNCTFLNIKMPAIGHKEDPAHYLQSDDLRFERCRFVQCEIPETLLAATVGCVFENCQFPSKKADWSKAKRPIKVNASIAGTGRVPPSYMNGPLSVTFAPGSIEGAGCTLPFSATGGRLVLSTLPQPTQFVMLGNVDKKASEIPDFSAVPPPPRGSVPPLATPPAGASGLPAKSAAAGEIRSIEELVRNLPGAIELAPRGQPNPTAVEAANAWFSENLLGKPASLRLKLDELQGYKTDGYVFKALAREQPLTYRGLTIPTRIGALFRADRAAPLSKIIKGGDLPVRGIVEKVEFESRGRGLGLTVTVSEAQTP